MHFLMSSGPEVKLVWTKYLKGNSIDWSSSANSMQTLIRVTDAVSIVVFHAIFDP